MNDHEFDQMLRAAKTVEPLPSSFNHEVWQRISPMPERRRLGGVRFSILLQYLSQPWGALASVAATVAIGLWLGNASVPEKAHSEQAYAESVSPFLSQSR
jgi:hypothetical protein